MNRGSAGDDRDDPGTTENNRGSTGKNHREGPAITGAAPATIGAAPGTTGTAPPRQSYGNAPVVAVNAGRCRWSNGIPRLCRDAAVFHRGSTWALPAKTGALPGLHRDSP
ncbi:hypothetical protein DPMN_167216 [Dreissena polymorpha]|nr:hypothetical protein DPMN_167216 [Dreissena polymorpha]